MLKLLRAPRRDGVSEIDREILARARAHARTLLFPYPGLARYPLRDSVESPALRYVGFAPRINPAVESSRLRGRAPIDRPNGRNYGANFAVFRQRAAYLARATCV